MRDRSKRLGGWRMVGWCAVLLATLTLVLLAIYGTGEQGLRVVIRTTARTSFVLFVGAFSAAALASIWPAPLSRWTLRNRRYLGVSFAVSHFIHLLAIIALVATVPNVQIAPATVIGGGLGYVFIAAMTATSFDRTAEWLGPRAWRRLHTVGVYYIWFIFFVSYAPRALVASPAYVPFVVILLAALGLRLGVRRFGRRPITAALPA